MRRILVSITFIFLTMFSPSQALATSIVSTSPTAGSVLSISPTAVTIKASQDLVEDANEITVTNSNGQRVDDGSIQIQGPVLMVGVKPLTTSGLYTVTYTLMAVDQPATSGTFTFLYNAPAEMTLPTPTPTEDVLINNSPNRLTDLFVVGLMIFAFIMLVFLSRYAKQTFNTPAKPRRVKKASSTSKKFIK